jgi:hypothetical protein
MLWQKAVLENGVLKVVSSQEVDQSKLTADCWSIQVEGLKACEKCEYLGKRNCGGKNIRKQLLGVKK